MFFVLLGLLIVAGYVAVSLGVTRQDTVPDARPEVPPWIHSLRSVVVSKRSVRNTDIEDVLGPCTDRRVLTLGQGQSCTVVLSILPKTSLVTRELKLRSEQPFQVQLVYSDIRSDRELVEVAQDGHYWKTVEVYGDGSQVVVTCPAPNSNCTIDLGLS